MTEPNAQSVDGQEVTETRPMARMLVVQGRRYVPEPEGHSPRFFHYVVELGEERMRRMRYRQACDWYELALSHLGELTMVPEQAREMAERFQRQAMRERQGRVVLEDEHWRREAQRWRSACRVVSQALVSRG